MATPILQRLLIGVFALILCLPGLGLLAGRKAGGFLTEKRTLQEWPGSEVWQAEPWNAMKAFELAFTDRHAWRAELIAADAWLNWKAFGRSSTPSVIVGKQGWLFFAGDRTLDRYQGRFRPTVTDYAYIADALDMRHRWLEVRGIKSLLAISPSKESIYPEFMPAGTPRLESESIHCPLMRLLERNSGTKRAIDLHDVLLKKKAQSGTVLYLRGDTHWNDLGAFTAYASMMQALDLADRVDHSLPELGRVNPKRSPSMDLAHMMGIASTYTDDWPNDSPVIEANGGWGFKSTRQNRAGVRDISQDGTQSSHRLLFYGDSFADALLPFFASSFGHLRLIQGPAFSPAEVEEYHPNVVISERVDRIFFLGRPAAAEETRVIHSPVWEKRFNQVQTAPSAFDFRLQAATLRLRPTAVKSPSGWKVRAKRMMVAIPLETKRVRPDGSIAVKLAMALESGGNLKWQFFDGTSSLPTWPIHIELKPPLRELFFGLPSLGGKAPQQLNLTFEFAQETSLELTDIRVLSLPGDLK